MSLSLIAIKDRITSVEKTNKITQAMKMVSAAKFKRNLVALDHTKDYGEGLEDILESLTKRLFDDELPALMLPILQLILGFLEIISWKKMLSAWRLVVMASAVAGAVLTPSTDPITMLLLSTSITFLFFVGIGLVALTTNLKGQIRPSFDP